MIDLPTFRFWLTPVRRPRSSSSVTCWPCVAWFVVDDFGALSMLLFLFSDSSPRAARGMPLHTTHDDTQCTAAYREPNNDDLEQLGNTDTIFHATLPLPALLTRLGFIPVPSPCVLFAELCLLQMSWHYWAWPVFVSHAAHTMTASLFPLKQHASHHDATQFNSNIRHPYS